MLVTPVAQEDQTFLGLPVLRDSGDPTRSVQTAANQIHSSAAAVRTATKLGGDWTRNKVLEAIEVTPEGESNILAVTAKADSARKSAPWPTPSSTRPTTRRNSRTTPARCASPQRSPSPRPTLDLVSILVADSGVGISPELLPRVFDFFTQGETRSSQPGLGIGLALARRLVELHAGRLDGRSEGDGRGSEFLIQLPLATTQSMPATERRAPDRRLERRILVIDDNEDAANATAMLIEEMGGEARVAYHAAKALSTCSWSTNPK